MSKRSIVRLLLASLAACSEATQPEAAPHLVFEVQPEAVGEGAGFARAVVVGVRDERGELVTGWTDPVSVTLEGPDGGGRLEGVASRPSVAGTVSFEGLEVSTPGVGYQLVAHSGGLREVASEAFDVPGGFRVRDVSAGMKFTCAVDEGGKAYCWGANPYGQLGDGTTESRSAPTAVATDVRFTSIAAGDNHTCGLAEDGTVHCWGQNLGGAVTGDRFEPDVLTPQAVALPARTVAVAVRSSRTCALSEDARLFCWGSTSAAGTVEQVGGELRFAGVSMGDGYSCAVTPAGAAYCWGFNYWGQLGDGTTLRRNVPTPVAGGYSFREVTASLGTTRTCGILKSGLTYCWGPQWVTEPDGPHIVLELTPVQLVGDPGFDALRLGSEVSCGVSAGSVYCWGTDPFGTGPESWFPGLEATPTRVIPDREVSALTIGMSHLCFADRDHQLWCWGDNHDGQLGNPANPIGWRTPVPVWTPGS